jgi:hypothetical protein
MSSIDPSSALATYLRGQLGRLSAVREPSVLGRPVSSQGKTQVKTSIGSERGDASAASEDLASFIARRVAAIDREAPDRRRKALRIFLESLLLKEWGNRLLNDPGFHQLVDGVQAQMESDACLRPLMEEAADRLLGPARN